MKKGLPFGAFLAGCGLSALLWVYWTPRCNESCSEGVALSMIAFAIVFPLACGATGAVLSSQRHSPFVKRTTLAVLALASSLLVATLTLLAS